RTAFIVIKHATGNQSYGTFFGHTSLYEWGGGPGTTLIGYGTNVLNGSAYVNGNITTPVGSIQKPTQYTILSFITTGNTNINTISSNGSNGFPSWNGDIAEILIYDNPLSDSTRQVVEQYLRNKYAPPVNLGPDITVNYGFAPITLTAQNHFVHHQWNMGNPADTLSNLIVSHSGTYADTVLDIFGFTSVDEVVVSYPVPVITGDTICLGDSILVSTGLGNNYNYAWNNGSTDTAIYVTSGSVWVTVTDSLSNFIVSDTIVVVTDNFKNTNLINADSINLCLGNTIQVDNAISQIAHYAWSNGDTLQIITPADSGWYYVTVTNLRGCFAEDSVFVTINGIAPIAGFITDTVCLGTFTTFIDTSSVAMDTISQWLWHFGDGDSSIFKNPAHLYTHADTFNVSLFVSTPSGCSNSITKSVIVKNKPTADFSVRDTCFGSPYLFTDLSSPVTSITSWAWNFGDSASGTDTSTLQNPSHFFSDTGSFTVSLFVNDSNGCSADTSFSVNVSNYFPITNLNLISPQNNTLISDSSVTFSWQSATNAISYTFILASDSIFTVVNTTINNLLINSCTASINDFTHSYFWKVIAYNICGDSDTSLVLKFNTFSPNSINGFVLWFTADNVIKDTTDKISQWSDLSGFNNHATQIDTSMQPSLIPNISILNNHPIVRFDGVNDYLSFNTISTVRTAFIVIKHATGNQSYGTFFGHTSLYEWGGGPGTTLIGYGTNVLNGSAYVNGNLVTPVSSIQKPTQYTILSFITAGNTNINTISSDGSNGFPSWNGNIAEIIIYNTALTTTQRQQVEQYFRFKYASPPVNLGPDIYSTNFCDTTLDASPHFIHYKWNTGNAGDTLSTLTVNTGGIYSVTATDVFGFTSVDTVIVNKPTIAVHDTLSCFGSSVTLITGLGAPYTFLWLPDSSTSNSINVVAPDTITLTVYDPDSCHVTRQIIITADSFPVQASLGNITNVCTGNEIGLAVGANEAVTYLWSDGETDSLFTIPWTSGSHDISVTVTNSMGCIATDTVTVSVQGQEPVAAFSSTSGCWPVITFFTDLSTVGGVGALINSRQWDFGDGSSDSIPNPMHFYQNHGIYLATLTVTSNKGCSKSLTDTAFVYSKPVPHFGPLNGCSGVLLTMYDMSSSFLGNVDIWNWNFGDPGSTNNTAFDDTVSHTYDTAGTYTVHLYVQTIYGCDSSVDLNVNIRPAPDVGFSYTNVCDGNPVYFTDTSHTEPWTQIYQWQWEFGSGQVSNIQNPVFIFDNAGTYPVVLTVKSVNGCIVTDTQNVVVHALPDADFNPDDACLGNPKLFNDGSTVLAPDSIAQWLWNFGFAQTSTLQNPLVTFNDSGAYNVSLLVTSSEGCKDSVIHSINVFPAPVADFIPDEFYGVAPFTTTFINNSQNALNYFWNFGDTIGITSTSFSPSYTYTYEDTAGFTVTLVAYNQYNCTDTAYQVLYVTPTRADIAVTNVKAVKQNNYVTLSADIANYGTRKINKMELSARANGGTAFIETWTDYNNTLDPGETMTYQFNAKYEILENQLTDYICAEAQIVNKNPDDNPANNEQCITFSNQFMVFEPYPTPTNDQVHIDFILPFSDNIEIGLYGAKGDKIKTIFSGIAEKGLNRLTVDISSLNLGVYYYRISFRDDMKILKFVKY
ncbi:MAG: PKD domain-containing protein, partial [Bacteroidales bacterium]